MCRMICTFFMTLFGGFKKSIIMCVVIEGLQSCSKLPADGRISQFIPSSRILGAAQAAFCAFTLLI